MPNRQFLEQYPLFRKLRIAVSPTLAGINKAPITAECDVCKSDQTFLMANEYYEAYANGAVPSRGQVVRLRYLCMSCRSYERFFMLRIADDCTSIEKVGQWPPWDIGIDDAVTRILGGKTDLFKRGLICESQGYGIGAFAYYRRIVEDVIDSLLDDIDSLLSGADQVAYRAALAKVKATRVTEEKIDLVKDLLPPSLRPGNVNPLGVLHSELSAGLHDRSEDECLASAEAVRGSLVFLVHQVEDQKARAKSFTDSMRKLLDRRSTSESKKNE